MLFSRRSVAIVRLVANGLTKKSYHSTVPVLVPREGDQPGFRKGSVVGVLGVAEQAKQICDDLQITDLPRYQKITKIVSDFYSQEKQSRERELQNEINVRSLEQKKDHEYDLLELESAKLKKDVERLLELYLATKGLLTTRGVFEFVLIGIHYELLEEQRAASSPMSKVSAAKRKKPGAAANKSTVPDKFNATNTCLLLANRFTDGTDLSKCPKAKRLKELAVLSNFKPENFASFYAELSKDIHGSPWSGPGVIVYVQAFTDTSYQTFVKSYVKDQGLSVVDATPSGGP